MSSITTPKDGLDGWRRSAAGQSRGRALTRTHSKRLGTYLSLLAMIVPAIVLLVVGVLAGMPPQNGEIENGVTVGGYEVSGSGWEETSEQLRTRLNEYLDQPITLSLGQNTIETTPRELGMSFDMDVTFERALDVGRGGLFDAARERLTAHTSGVTVAPVVTYDSDQYVEALRALSDGVVTRPTNAEFNFDGDQVKVLPAKDGVGVDTAAGANALQHAVGEFQNGSVTIPTVAIEPEVTTADLEAVQQEANRLAGQPIILRDRETAWQFRPRELVDLLSYETGSVSLNMEAIEARIGALEPQINQQTNSAQVTRNDDGSFAIQGGSISRELDIDASVNLLEQSLESDRHEFQLVVEEEQPSVSAGELHALYQQLNDIVNRGMTITWDQGEKPLDKAAYSKTLVYNEQQGTVSFNRKALTDLVKPIADSAARPPSGLRWQDGRFVTTESSSPGMDADLEASVDAVIDAALNGKSTASLVLKETMDPMAAAASIKVNDVLGYAKSYYGDSIPNRKTNIEVAVNALDGVLIPPHSEFSFNEAIGGVPTLDDGYTIGYGIITGSNGQPQTVPSIAGGICQVSTMVFQAAFWSGMPITSRSWHLYWIPKYGTGPGGLKGLDATVAPSAGLDFKFQNPTDDWLAISAYADGQYVSIELRGVNQGWFVEVGDPKITNVVEADTETIHYQEDASMEPGQQLWVESARDGFNASIHRTVRGGDGKVIRETTFESYYKPARNVVLVAPGEAPTNQ